MVERSCSSTLTGVALGISIGSLSVFFALGKLDEDSAEDRTHTYPDSARQSREFLQHEALRYGSPSSANVHVRSGYVVSYDYR